MKVDRALFGAQSPHAYGLPKILRVFSLPTRLKITLIVGAFGLVSFKI